MTSRRWRRMLIFTAPVLLLVGAAFALGPLLPSPTPDPPDPTPTPRDALIPDPPPVAFAELDSLPDERLLLYSGWDLYGLGGDPVRLEPLGDQFAPHALSDDGRRLLAVSTPRLKPGAPTPLEHLLSIDLDTGERRVVSRVGAEETIPHSAWAPDGRVAHTLVRERRGPMRDDLWQVCILDSDDDERTCTRVSGPVYDLDWAPTGDRVLIAGDTLEELDPASEELTELFSPATLDIEDLDPAIDVRRAEWSPSGRYVAALLDTRLLVLLDTDGRVHQLVRGRARAPAPERSPVPPRFAWNPTRDTLVVTTGDGARIVQADGGREMILGAPAADASIVSVTWSPSERHLAFTGVRLADPQRPLVWIMPPHGHAMAPGLDRASFRLRLPAEIIGWVAAPSVPDDRS